MAWHHRRALPAILTLALAACGTSPTPTATPLPSSTTSDAPSEPPSAAPSVHPLVGAWVDTTADTIGETAEWTNKVEAADIDADGQVDLLFANGGDYDTPGTPVASAAFLGAGDGTFTNATEKVFGDWVGLTRVIKARDLDGDGRVDLVLGTTYNTQSQLLVGSGDGRFENVTETHLPAADLSVGDLEIGDVDADGDLDIVLADWGDEGPPGGEGRTRLWLNDGSGRFRDATRDQMPETLVGFSWDIELLDVDNDWDLDLTISCKTCAGSFLFENDGTGAFTDVTDGRMPQFPNNYEFAPIDLDGDGFLDLVTINDGQDLGSGFIEHVFRNEGGTFVDATPEWWPAEHNVGWDDNVVVALDVESDGDADFVIGSLDGPDRLLVNDGSGGLTLVRDIIGDERSGGTLGWAIADLNGDHRPDMVEAQGEVTGHEAERLYLAGEAVLPDTAPPLVVTGLGPAHAGRVTILARVQDHRTPNMPHDWQAVEVRVPGADAAPMLWYGENLFRATVNLPLGEEAIQVCAVDAAGNETCAAV